MYQEPVTKLKYVGPQKAGRLVQLGIRTVEDLLWHFPRRYEDRTNLKDLAEAVHGETITIQATVLGWEDRMLRPRLRLYRALLQGRAGTGYGVWFNQPHIKRQLPTGVRVVLTGKASFRGRIPEIIVHDFENPEFADKNIHTGRIVPFYPLTAGLSQRWFRLVINHALEAIEGELLEILPAELCRAYRLIPRFEAIRYMHNPPTMKDLHQAQRRLKYEELLVWELGLNLKRRHREKEVQGIAHSPNNHLVRELVAGLPYQLTDAQKRVLAEILSDMEASRPMTRLLQGDVGSGKTVIAAAAMAKALQGGWQAALMAPTEVLAEQHGRTLQEIMNPLQVPVVVLTGSTPRTTRDSIIAGLATGQLPLVVGTHALIQDDVEFKALGLVIIDEQHRFGVNQRAALEAKGREPDLMVMTATPIPRTLALAVYGDMDISVIDQMPPGRQPVKTYVLSEKQKRKAYELIRREVAKGHQAFVICPLIEESENITAEAARDMADKLKEVFPDLRVGLVHGRMRPGDKEETMTCFRDGRLDILVATTVVEVGIHVPNATVMLIEGAERMGLAQLHQLRGRVGRGQNPAYCILITDDKSRERLNIMATSQDGFTIAEADLRIRGPGEFFGTRQHGVPEFHLAELPRDARILEQARHDARKICDGEDFHRHEYRHLMETAAKKMSNLYI